MSRDDFSIPQTGLAVIHFLVVSGQDRSSEFCRSVYGATVVLDRDRVILSPWPPDRRTRIVKHWPDELQNVTAPNDASRRIAESGRLEIVLPAHVAAH